MKVVTCVSDLQQWGYTKVLTPSCRHFNLDLVTLRHNQSWSSHRLKDQYLRAYLKTVHPDEVVMFTDGYDALLLCSEEEIIRKFRDMKKPIIFSAERFCWPDRNLKGLYPPSTTPFQFLNCGGFIGSAGAIGDLLAAYQSPPSIYSGWDRFLNFVRGGSVPYARDRYAWSNQYYWSCIFLLNSDIIGLDYRAEIFLTLSTGLSAQLLRQFKELGQDSDIFRYERARLAKDCRIVEERIHHTLTNTFPCHVHFNGPVVRSILSGPQFRGAMPWSKRRNRPSRQ